MWTSSFTRIQSASGSRQPRRTILGLKYAYLLKGVIIMAFHIRYFRGPHFHRLHNFSKLTLDEYKKGTWRVENYTEEKLFEKE